ncbi:MAG: exodeoxyribonuclease VII small subunit [Myxococcota bacterium]
MDEILDGLESVVTELEAGDLPLEDALKRFEQGVELARKGSTVLDAVEERVEELLADRDEAVPFDDGE